MTIRAHPLPTFACLVAWALVATASHGATVADGFALLAKGDTSAARAAFEPACAGRPPDARACQGLARVLLAGQPADADGAVSLLEKAIAAEPAVADHHAWLAHALEVKVDSQGRGISQLGRARRLRAELLKALELDPNHFDARQGLVRFYDEAPGIAGGSAAKALEEARRLAAQHPGDGHVVLGNLLAGEDWAGAEAAFREAARLAPRDVAPLINVAQAQSQQGKFDESVATARRALALVPHEPHALYLIGRAAAVGGRELEAGAASLREILSNPAQLAIFPPAVVHWRLGQILLGQGDRAGARAAFEAALAADPTFKEARASLKELG